MSYFIFFWCYCFKGGFNGCDSEIRCRWSHSFQRSDVMFLSLVNYKPWRCLLLPMGTLLGGADTAMVGFECVTDGCMLGPASGHEIKRKEYF